MWEGEGMMLSILAQAVGLKAVPVSAMVKPGEGKGF